MTVVDITPMVEAAVKPAPKPGLPEHVSGTEFTTVDNFDPKVHAKAYELFLSTDMCLTDIALDLGIGQQVVALWSRRGKWREHKQQILDELIHSAEDKFRSVLVQQRLPVAERHLRVSKKIEETVEKVMDEATADDRLPNDMKLKRLAETWASVTAVSARAVGISDRPFSKDAEIDESRRRVPLVVIGIKPQASPDAVTIDVREVDDE